MFLCILCSQCILRTYFWVLSARVQGNFELGPKSFPEKGKSNKEYPKRRMVVAKWTLLSTQRADSKHHLSSIGARNQTDASSVSLPASACVRLRSGLRQGRGWPQPCPGTGFGLAPAPALVPATAPAHRRGLSSQPGPSPAPVPVQSLAPTPALASQGRGRGGPGATACSHTSKSPPCLGSNF